MLVDALSSKGTEPSPDFDEPLEHMLSCHRANNQCFALAHEYLLLARSRGDVLLESQALYCLGISFFSGGNLDAAEQHLRQSFGLTTALSAPAWRARVASKLGSVHVYRDNAATGVDLLSLSLDTYRALDLRKEAANTQCHLAECFLRLGMFEQALPLLVDARNVFRELGLESFLALTYWVEGGLHLENAVHLRRSGDLHGMLDKAQRACEAMDVAMRSDRSAAHKNILAGGFVNLGFASVMRQDLKTAQAALEMISVELSADVAPYLFVARDLLQAKIQRLQGSPEQALKTLDQTFVSHDFSEMMTEERLEYHEERAVILESLDDMESALAAWRQFHAEESRVRDLMDRSRAALMAHYFELDRLRQADEIEAILRQQLGARQQAQALDA